MILSAGWGTMWYALRMMRYAQRVMDNQRVRRGWSSHGRAALRAEEDARESFDCYKLCQDCRYLGEDPSRCPNCHGTNIVDLQDKQVAARLREWEEDERSRVPRKVRRVGTILGIVVVLLAPALATALTALVLLTLSAVDAAPRHGGTIMVWAFWVGLALGAVGLVVLRALGGRWLTWLYYRWRPEAPRRWRRPVPIEDRDTPESERFRGVARSRGELLEAPFSYRPCLGYRLLVMFDARGDARPPQAMLDESRVADVEVAGRDLDGAETTLAGSPEPVVVDDETFAGEPLRRFMRRRGMYPQDGELAFFEVLLEPGQGCEVAMHPRSTSVGPTVHV
jgi:hypothetical protein